VTAGIVLSKTAQASDFHGNNIFENGAAAHPDGGLVDLNCGILNASGNRLEATENFWGAVTGPGADPADASGGACDKNGSATVSKPFATEYQ